MGESKETKRETPAVKDAFAIRSTEHLLPITKTEFAFPPPCYFFRESLGNK